MTIHVNRIIRPNTRGCQRVERDVRISLAISEPSPFLKLSAMAVGNGKKSLHIRLSHRRASMEHGEATTVRTGHALIASRSGTAQEICVPKALLCRPSNQECAN